MKYFLLSCVLLMIMTTSGRGVSMETPSTETASLGAGCFWCGEAVFERIEGVLDVKSGYMGGHVKAPSYRDVTTGETGHAEIFQVTFDPNVLSFSGLLDVFWQMHDPTTLNRQGADVGTQYRSVIFFHTPEQKEVAEASKKRHQEELKAPIVTEITPASTFYEAEDYHQDYFRNNASAPYCRFVIAPKLKKLKLNEKEPTH